MIPEQSSAPALLALLATDAGTELKGRACRQLSIVGGPDAVPTLAGFLADEKISVFARSALESINDPAAGTALIKALPTLEGALLAGAIDSLGVRREASAVPALKTLAYDADRGAGPEAVSALGRIGTPPALATLETILTSGPSSLLLPAAHAALAAADRLLREDRADAAQPLLQALGTAALPGHLHAAARTLQTNPPPVVRKPQIFDGRTFNGWEGDFTWFRTANESIVAGRLDRPIPQNEFLCYHRDVEDFELRLQVRLLNGRGNGGIQFRSQRIEGEREMIGYQADVAPQHWGALYDESRRRKFLGTRPDPALITRILKPVSWNHYVIRCEGPRVRLWLNGVLTTDFTETDPTVPRMGKIAVQIHSGSPAEVWYRALELEELRTA